MVYYKSKALIECQKLAEYGTELIKRKKATKTRLRRVIGKQIQDDKYDNVALIIAKKREIQKRLNTLTEMIKHCGEEIHTKQIKCENDYPREKMQSIFRNIRGMELENTGTPTDFSLQTDVSTEPSNVEKPNEKIKQEKSNLEQLEDLLKEAKEREDRTLFLHRCIIESDLSYTRQAFELMLNNSRLLHICLLGFEMVRDLLMPNNDVKDLADCQKDTKQDVDEYGESAKFNGPKSKTDEME
ncbi:hypothetical protein ACH3XW_47370 [Acanthocheilonema viteae]